MTEKAKRIKAIVKHPSEEFGHVGCIYNSLLNLQNIVDGFIEVVPVDQDAVMICNEEGKLRGLEPNFYLGGDLIVGTVIFVGIDGDEFTDLPWTFQEYKERFHS